MNDAESFSRAFLICVDDSDLPKRIPSKEERELPFPPAGNLAVSENHPRIPNAGTSCSSPSKGSAMEVAYPQRSFVIG